MSFARSIFISLLFIPFLVFAQNQSALPNPGLTPESRFYFLDRLGEAVREFFTFNPEVKARLQITFAAERIAEIKIILETKGVKAKGLEIAQSRLEAHLAKVLGIIEEEKAKGKDTSILATTLSQDWEAKKEALKQVFEEREKALETREEKLKAKIRVARQSGDTIQLGALFKELVEVKAQKELLELEEEELEEELEDEEERLEEEMETKAEAEKAIREAEKEKQEIIDEAQEEGLEIPAGTFEKFDKLLAQAKELLSKGNYQGAKQLAEQAEKSLDNVEEALEDLEAAKEKEEELKEEQEEKEREAREEKAERMREAAEKEAKRLGKEREQAQEETRKAEKRLRKAGEDKD